MREHDADAVRAFFAQTDEDGVSNEEKARTRSRVIRRVASTPKNKSYEEVSGAGDVADMPSLRILGLQDNQIEALDPTGLPACQGIDAGMNRLTSIDVSRNPELVELYVNANRLRELDTSRNPKLKYLRCQDNQLTQLDTTSNPLLRHLYATGNPLKRISALAPGSDGRAPLRLTAGEGGAVGLSFNPIYNAQWKETGEWEQSYHAYPAEGFAFEAWLDEAGNVASRSQDWEDEYGTSRQLTAQFKKLEMPQTPTAVE